MLYSHGGPPMGEIAPEATAAGFSFREVSNARAWSAPLENGARNIWRTEFSLAGVPAGRTHFKVCERRKTASGIYLWLSACTFWGRGKKELSYTACSYPDIGCVYTRKKKCHSGKSACGAPGWRCEGCRGSARGRLGKHLSARQIPSAPCTSEGAGCNSFWAA